jgi:hypothetical protein
LFSEWISTSVASMSNTTGSALLVTLERRHTWLRTLAMASHSHASTPGVIRQNVRYTVESDGTAPNSRSWARRYSMSVHASPPPASISIAWVNTLPRSCNGSRSPAGGMRVDRVSPSPSRSANAPRACSPTWATTPSPPASTLTRNVLLPFTRQEPFP